MTLLRVIDKPVIINDIKISDKYAVPLKICRGKNCLECRDTKCEIFPVNKKLKVVKGE